MQAQGWTPEYQEVKEQVSFESDLEANQSQVATVQGLGQIDGIKISGLDDNFDAINRVKKQHICGVWVLCVCV